MAKSASQILISLFLIVPVVPQLRLPREDFNRVTLRVDKLLDDVSIVDVDGDEMHKHLSIVALAVEQPLLDQHIELRSLQLEEILHCSVQTVFHHLESRLTLGRKPAPACDNNGLARVLTHPLCSHFVDVASVSLCNVHAHRLLHGSYASFEPHFNCPFANVIFAETNVFSLDGNNSDSFRVN